MQIIPLGTEKTFDIYPTMGMITALPPSMIPPHAATEMCNCVLFNGKLRKRPGFVQFPSGAAAFGSPVLGITSVQDEDDSTHLFAITAVGLKKYNAGVWDTMTGPALTGATDRLFWTEVSQNALVFSQGVNQVMRMPFTGSTYAILNANCPAARYGTRGADRLLLAHTLETGTPKPFRVRRPVASDHTDWTGIGSGFTDLTEFPYHISGMRKIGSRIAVYTRGSINVGTRTEDAEAPLAWDPVVSESGLAAGFTLHGRRNAHFGLGDEDFFEFDGVNYTPIGTQIRDYVFSTLNAARLHVMFSVVIQATQEWLCFVCSGDSTIPDKVWVYNWGRQAWCYWTVGGPRCATLHRDDTTRTWDTLPGAWDSYQLEWDNFALQTLVLKLLTGNDDGKVYEWSLEHFSDNGSAIRAFWASKDFTSMDFDPSIQSREITLQDLTLRFQHIGNTFSLDVYVSTDGGETWGGPHTLSIPSGSGLGEVTLSEQITGGRIRFKIEQFSATETFIIDSIHPRFSLRGAVVKGQ